MMRDIEAKLYCSVLKLRSQDFNKEKDKSQVINGTKASEHKKQNAHGKKPN
jgi:hypothetical protein